MTPETSKPCLLAARLTLSLTGCGRTNGQPAGRRGHMSLPAGGGEHTNSFDRNSRGGRLSPPPNERNAASSPRYVTAAVAVAAAAAAVAAPPPSPPPKETHKNERGEELEETAPGVGAFSLTQKTFLLGERE